MVRVNFNLPICGLNLTFTYMKLVQLKFCNISLLKT